MTAVPRPHRPTLFAIALLGCACGEISTPELGGNGGGVANAGGAGAAGVGRGGAGGTAGQGGRGPSDPGEEDAGASGGASGGAAGSGSGVPTGCPVPAPVPVTGQSVAIQSVRFTSESDPDGSPAQIVLRNVSTSAITLLGGRLGWQWCNVPGYWAITDGADVTLEPGATFAFIPIYNTTGPRPLYRGDDPYDTNEMGIYPKSGTFDEADQIMAFVMWGAGSLGDTREQTAVLAGLWTHEETVAIGANDAGFIATGPTDRGSGYTGVPARCLVAPPNP